MHLHQHLDLYVDGRQVPVPAGIGIDPALRFAPLHTHDASGVIHLESPTVRTYTLGQFFAVWGVRFTRSCLGPPRSGGRGSTSTAPPTGATPPPCPCLPPVRG